MRIIDQLVYKITGDSSGFEKTMTNSNKAFTGFSKAASLALAGLSAGAVAMGIKKLADFTKQAVTALDTVDKMSQKIGLSRTAYQEWDFILGQSGASVDDLQMSLKTLSNAAAEAMQGTKQYSDEFDRLGISVTDANGKLKDQETLFNEVFFALAGMQDQTQRTATASALLGRSATELAPALNTSKEGLEALKNQAHELGLVYEDELVNKGVRLGDNIDSLKRAFIAARNQALAPIITALLSVTDGMLGQTKQTTSLEKQTRTLTTQNSLYKSTLAQLLDPTKTLTDIERARLSVLKETQSASLEQTVLMTAEAYKKDSERIKEASLRLEEMNIRQDAFALAVNDSVKAQDRIKELQKSINLGNKEGVDVTRQKIELQTILATLDMDNNERQIESADIITDVSNAQKELNQLTEGYGTAMRDIAVLVSDGTIKIDKYAVTNKKFYDSVMAVVDELNIEKEAMEFANEQYKQYENASQEVISAQIKLLEQYGKTRESELLLEKLRERQNVLLAESARLAGEVTVKDGARKAIIDNVNTSLQNSVLYEKALGDSYDLEASQISILTNGIQALIDSGLTPESAEVKNLVSQLNPLVEATNKASEATKESSEATKESSQSTKTTQEVLVEYSKGLTDASNKLAVFGDENDYVSSVVRLTKDTILALIASGLDPMDEKIQELQEQIAKLSQNIGGLTPEIEENRTAFEKWVDDNKDGLSELTQELNGFSRIFSGLGGLYEAITEKRLALLDEQMQEELKTQGLSEDTEMESLQKRYDEAVRLRDLDTQEELTTEMKRLKILQDYDEKKKKIQLEEAKRQKVLSTFQAVIDTASAVIEAMPNPVLMALAAGTGALQLATIASTPLPSFDVGSIRVPRDTQAVVHRNEMILPAPIAEQARQEGINIQPQGSSTSPPIHLILMLDGREIGETTVKGINAGQFGKIDARVVKR